MKCIKVLCALSGATLMIPGIAIADPDFDEQRSNSDDLNADEPGGMVVQPVDGEGNAVGEPIHVPDVDKDPSSGHEPPDPE